MVGTVLKANIGFLEENIREGFLMRLRKDMTGVVQEVVGKRIYLVKFQDGGGRRRCIRIRSPLWLLGVKYMRRSRLGRYRLFLRQVRAVGSFARKVLGDAMWLAMVVY